MKTRTFQSALAAGLLLLTPLAFGQAKQGSSSGRIILDEPGYSVRSRLDWAAGVLRVEITHTLDPATPSLPRAKGDAETDIQSRLSGFLVTAISGVTVDSSHTYGELLRGDPALFDRVSDVAAGAQVEGTVLSDDFSQLIARYALPLFGQNGIASPLFPTRSVAIPSRLGWVPTRPFSGLLIYAKGKLPAAGSNGAATARPALFPRIFDEDMTLVLDKGMCSPEALARWGMVGYAASLEDSAALLRVGELPLRLVARGVFGDNDTDIVIPTEGVRQLLILPENRALLREGRIVIVYESLD